MQRQRHIHIVTKLNTLQLVCLFLISGCYPHRGLPTNYTANELADRAQMACSRQDQAAWETLARRLHEKYPEDTRAKQSMLLIEQDRPCDQFIHTHDARR